MLSLPEFKTKTTEVGEKVQKVRAPMIRRKYNTKMQMSLKNQIVGFSRIDK